jgi:hypothetical protein
VRAVRDPAQEAVRVGSFAAGQKACRCQGAAEDAYSVPGRSEGPGRSVTSHRAGGPDHKAYDIDDGSKVRPDLVGK